ncbi:MAG: GNAT family N-acetyltransferase [Nakamurella sp.]
MTEFQLRPARPPEASAISDLAMRSKAHWGYDDDFLNACRTELTIAPDWCDGVRLIVAESAGVIIGFYRLSGEAPEGTLEALFVDEPMIGSGLGRRLFADAVDRARRLCLDTLLIDADPGAEPFYQHMGAERIGESASGSIPDRMLPRLRLAL